ncbi:MAG: 30S ribosome-binding factor RbfA [Planctomycetota bacterium]
MSRRLLKAAEAIREVVATAILTDLRDPRISDVTVVGVEVTPDMREAKVSVTVMGDDKKERLCLRGLENSTGFLQSKIANRIETRYIPKLRFVIDRGAENAMAVERILEQIRREKEGLPPLPGSPVSTGEEGEDALQADASQTDDSDESTLDLPDADPASIAAETDVPSDAESNRD